MVNKGQAVVEYALIVALLACVMVGVLVTLGAVERQMFANFSAVMGQTTDATGNIIPGPTPGATPTCDPNLPSGKDDNGKGKGQCK